MFDPDLSPTSQANAERLAIAARNAGTGIITVEQLKRMRSEMTFPISELTPALQDRLDTAWSYINFPNNNGRLTHDFSYLATVLDQAAGQLDAALNRLYDAIDAGHAVEDLLRPVV